MLKKKSVGNLIEKNKTYLRQISFSSFILCSSCQSNSFISHIFIISSLCRYVLIHTNSTSWRWKEARSRQTRIVFEKWLIPLRNKVN